MNVPSLHGTTSATARGALALRGGCLLTTIRAPLGGCVLGGLLGSSYAASGKANVLDALAKTALAGDYLLLADVRCDALHKILLVSLIHAEPSNVLVRNLVIVQQRKRAARTLAGLARLASRLGLPPGLSCHTRLGGRRTCSSATAAHVGCFVVFSASDNFPATRS